MQEWLNFFFFVFFLLLVFIYSNYVNFISMIFYGEFFWILLYIITVSVGSYIDDITVISFSFFLLGFAGLEYCFGLLLLILFKELNITNFLLNTNTNDISTTNTTKLLNNFYY